MIINQEERACKAWNILTDSAKNRSLISYKELGVKTGIHHRAVKYVLALIQNYCMDNEYPPLTILVINQNTGKPGGGFIAWDIENSDDGVNKVYDFSWKRLKNPFGFAETGLTSENLVHELIKNPDSSSEIYALIKVRGTTQRLFRNALLQVYNNSCCICGLSIDNALEACHIIPYSKSDSKQRLEISNGMLLCSNHHKMFDCGQITINQDCTINYFNKNKNEGDYSTYDRLMTIDLNGKLISLPNDNKHKPKKEYLLKHQKTYIE
jgi:putative restriction endonuclease